MLSGDSLKKKIPQLEVRLIREIKSKLPTLQSVNRYRTNSLIAKNIDKFTSFLNPREKDNTGRTTQYFQKLITYVLALSGNLNQANFDAIFADQQVDEEIDALFQTPKKIAEAWDDADYFGYTWQGTKYNCDNVLRLLIKINFLKAAALKEEVSTEWKNEKWVLLQQVVDNFARDQDQNLITEQERVTPEEQYRLQPDDTLDRDNFVGYAHINLDTLWPAYWDAFWPLSPGGLREDPSLFPLQMQHARVYPWYERVLYFLVGGDVRKYFKDQWRSLKLGFEEFKTVISDYYNKDDQYYSGGPIGNLLINLIAMLVCDLPTALVKGLLGLPFRLARALINSVCDEGLLAWQESMELVNKFEILLLFGLFIAARIPLAALAFVGGCCVGTVLSAAVGIVASFAKYIVKPIIECFAPNVDEPEEEDVLQPQELDADPAPVPSVSQRLMAQLMRAQHKLGEQNEQLIIGDHVLSKQEIVTNMDLLRRQKPVRDFDWLLEIKDFSVASTARLFILPLPAHSPVGQPVPVNDAVAPANSVPN